MRVTKSVLACVVAVFLAETSSGQTTDTATIDGHVAEQAGRAVADATVEIRQPGSAFHRSALTRVDGTFVIGQIPVAAGTILEVRRAGFQTRTEGPFVLRAGERARFDIVIAPEAVRSEVTVYGTTGGVQSNSSQLGVRLDAQRIQNTPLLGNKLTSLPLLDSAVRPARGTGDIFLNDTLFVIDGGGRRQPDYRIDGATANDSWGRQSIFTSLPVETVAEMTVLTYALSAEYGRSVGGVINVVTRSGASRFTGGATATYRPAELEAKAPVTNVEANDVLKLGNVYLSGPIAGSTYFLLDGQYADQTRRSGITSPLVGAPSSYDGEYQDTDFFGKVDHDLSDGNRATLRFSSQVFHDTNPQDAVGGLNQPSTARVFRRNTYSGQLADSAVLTPDVFNEASLEANVGSPITQFDPVDLSTQYVRPGVSTEGTSQSALLSNHEVQILDTVTLSSGNHSFKFGGDAIRVSAGGNSKEFGGPFTLGQFTFATGISPSIPTSQLSINDVTKYVQGFGNAAYEADETLWSLFAQDDLRLLPDLTLNVGIRYDRQTLTDATTDFSPRLGFAWNPDGDPRTSVRGGFGIYYSELPANITADWTIGGPAGIYSFSATPGQLGFPPSLEPLPQFPPGAALPPRNITIRPGEASYYSQFFDISALPGYQDKLLNPRTDQARLGVEHDFGDGWFASLDAVHSRTVDLIMTIDLNAPSEFMRTAQGQSRSGVAADATRPITPVANGYRIIACDCNLGEAKYDGLQFNLRKQFSDKGAFFVSYTWSHSRNNVEPDAPATAPNDVHELGQEWANSLIDQRHRFAVSGWTRLPLGFMGGGVFSAASGRPYNILTGSDNNGDGSSTDRPVVDGSVIGRNAGLGASTSSLDLFLARKFPLGDGASITLRAEGFNLTNRENVYLYNATYGNGATPLSTFGQPLGGVTSVDPGRAFQFQARVAF